MLTVTYNEREKCSCLLFFWTKLDSVLVFEIWCFLMMSSLVTESLFSNVCGSIGSEYLRALVLVPQINTLEWVRTDDICTGLVGGAVSLEIPGHCLQTRRGHFLWRWSFFREAEVQLLGVFFVHIWTKFA